LREEHPKRKKVKTSWGYKSGFTREGGEFVRPPGGKTSGGGEDPLGVELLKEKEPGSPGICKKKKKETSMKILLGRVPRHPSKLHLHVKTPAHKKKGIAKLPASPEGGVNSPTIVQMGATLVMDFRENCTDLVTQSLREKVRTLPGPSC